jgi:hypothetical protein
MLVSVTPCWVAPEALPGPHGEARVPNVCADVDGLPVPLGEAEVVLDDDEVGRLLLQAVARSTADSTSATAPSFTVLLSVNKSTPC